MGKVKYLIMLVLVVGLISGCELSVGDTGHLMGGTSLTFTYEKEVELAKYQKDKDLDSIHAMTANGDVIRTGNLTSFKAKILEKRDNNVCYVEVIIPDGKGNEKMYAMCTSVLKNK
jgi:hypothetical protein